MSIFVPHKTLIETMWYAGLSIEEIDNTMVDNKYNPMPAEVYEGIISMVRSDSWDKAHEKNKKINAYNKEGVNALRPKALYYVKEDFSEYSSPDATFDIMSYVAGARILGIGLGSYKTTRMFTTSKLRQFIEIATMVGMANESIRINLAKLDPSFGSWSNRTLLLYTRIFWDASRVALRSNNIRNCDIRDYYRRDDSNQHYYPHRLHLDGTEDDVLSYFGLSDYSAIARNNKSIHSKIGGQITEYIEQKSRKVMPTDYIKLYIHLNEQIQELENRDQGAEEYRREINRIFDRLQHMQENYKTMDELNKEYIAIDKSIMTDEHYIKDPNK